MERSSSIGDGRSSFVGVEAGLEWIRRQCRQQTGRGQAYSLGSLHYSFLGPLRQGRARSLAQAAIDEGNEVMALYGPKLLKGCALPLGDSTVPSVLACTVVVPELKLPRRQSLGRQLGQGGYRWM